MDWLEFIASVIGSLAWPVAAIIIGFMFREQVRKLLAKMKTFKGPGGIEASFSEEAAAVLQQTEKIGTPTAIQGPAPTEKRPKAEVAVDPEARTSAVVIAVWQKIESMLVDLLDLKRIDMLPTDMRHWNVNAVIETLMRKKVIDEKTADLLHSLYKLRSWVAHNDFEPDPKATNEFFQAAERVINLLESTTEKLLTEGGSP